MLPCDYIKLNIDLNKIVLFFYIYESTSINKENQKSTEPNPVIF